MSGQIRPILALAVSAVGLLASETVAAQGTVKSVAFANVNPWVLWGTVGLVFLLWLVTVVAARWESRFLGPAVVSTFAVAAGIATVALIALVGYWYGRRTAIGEVQVFLASTASIATTPSLLTVRDTVTLLLAMTAASFLLLFVFEARFNPPRIETYWGGLGGGGGGWHISLSLTYFILALSFVAATMLAANGTSPTQREGNVTGGSATAPRTQATQAVVR